MLLSRILRLETWLVAGGRYAVAALALLIASADRGAAQNCTEAQIITAQEEGSATLKRINGASTPQIEQRMRELQKARGWSDHDLDDKAYEQLEDGTIRALDKEMATLITRMETLTEPSGGLPVCERLVELRSTLDRMRDISQQKSKYLLAKLDRRRMAQTKPRRMGQRRELFGDRRIQLRMAMSMKVRPQRGHSVEITLPMLVD